MRNATALPEGPVPPHPCTSAGQASVLMSMAGLEQGLLPTDSKQQSL